MNDQGKLLCTKLFSSEIELWISLLFAFILAFILIPSGLSNLYLYIYIPLTATYILLYFRRFYFYEDKIVVVFLHGKIFIPIENIEKIKYENLGAGSIPVLKIFRKKTKYNKFILPNSLLFSIYNTNKAALIIKHYKNDKIIIEFKTSEANKMELMEKIGE